MKNKTLGSTLIVAGTTIGAGMLAMPLTSSGMGFGFTVLLLFALWLLLSYSALLFVEVYQTSAKDAGIASLAEQYFGATGRILATLSLVIFMYAILSAYTISGGNLLKYALSFFGDQAEAAAIIAFVAILGTFVIIGIHSVDAINRLLFFAMVAAFFVMLVTLLANISLDNLMAMPVKYALFISASPVFFTSFGFHVVIPSLNNYLDGDIRRLRIAIIAGTGIPLFAYVAWQMGVHGIFEQSQFIAIFKDSATLDDLRLAIQATTNSEFLGEFVRIFSALALITSFLGVSMALFDCLRDLFYRINVRSNRFILGVFTFVPVLIVSLGYRDFLGVLTYAGIMFVFYGLVLPVGMAWRVRRLHPEVPYRVAGGNIGLLIALVLGILIMSVPYLVEAGYLPPVVG